VRKSVWRQSGAGPREADQYDPSTMMPPYAGNHAGTDRCRDGVVQRCAQAVRPWRSAALRRRRGDRG